MDSVLCAGWQGSEIRSSRRQRSHPAGKAAEIPAAKDLGLRTALEVFADRAYEEDGSLVNRRKEGAMITDEELAVSRVVRMVKEKKVTAITGKDIPIQADSVCVHGDGAKALAFVEKIRRALTDEGVEICALDRIV